MSKPAYAMLVATALLCACSGGRTRALPDDEFVGAPAPREHAEDDAPRAERPETRSGVLWYRLSFDDTGLHVRLRLASPPERPSFFLPGPWAGDDDHHAAIRLRGARTPQGSRPVTLHRHERRVEIDAGKTPWVELIYDVDLADRSGASERFSPQRVGSGYFAYAPTFLVLPSARVCDMLVDIPIEVRVPETFRVVSNWTLVHESASRTNPDERVHGFLASDVPSLSDAFITAHTELDVSTDGANTLAFERTFAGDREGIADAVRRTVEHYGARFGEQPSVTTLVRTPHSGGGRLLWGTGRRRGFVLELDAEAPTDTATHVLIAHEAFHLWNGHALVPEPAQEEKLRWFKEGLTQYVALKSLVAMGEMSEREVLDEWAAVAARYTHALETPDDPLLREQFPYDHGLLLALTLDQAIKADTENARDLDDWMRALLGTRDARTIYTQASLRAALERIAGESGASASAWTRLVERRSTIEPEALFASLGLHYLPPARERSARLIPLEDGASLFRSIIDEGHSAHTPR